MTHTPGPWTVSELDHRTIGPRRIVRMVDGECPQQLGVAQVFYRFDPETVGNAHLIAAAPDLLAALKAVLASKPELWGDHVRNGVLELPIEEDAVDAAERAIAKAEGRR